MVMIVFIINMQIIPLFTKDIMARLINFFKTIQMTIGDIYIYIN